MSAPKKKGDCVYIDFTTEAMAKSFHHDNFESFKELTIQEVDGKPGRKVYFKLRKSDDEFKRGNATRLFGAKLKGCDDLDGMEVKHDKHTGYVRVESFRVFSISLINGKVEGKPIMKHCTDSAIEGIEDTLRKEWSIFIKDFQ